MNCYPPYCVAIRTLGKAGKKYTDLINSLKQQTHPPKAIFVYIAEGYQTPVQVADEIYITTPKGMVCQRAQRYDEVGTEYILFCDDDMYLPSGAVQILFEALTGYHADCIAVNAFPNHGMSLTQKIKAGVLYGTLPSFFSRYAFRIRNSSFYSYAMHPQSVMLTQSFSGACFLVRKTTFLQARCEEECWMDQFPYVQGDDQMLSYKMYLGGNVLLVHYDSGIEHRDAKTSHVDSARERFYNNGALRYVIWYRSVYQTRRSALAKFYASVCFYTAWFWQFLLSLALWILRIRTYRLRDTVASLLYARRYVSSESFRELPVWQRCI